MTDCRVRAPSSVKPYRGAVLQLASAAALLYAGAPASAQGVIEKHPKFEVISIRRHTAESGPVQTGPAPDGFRLIGVPMFAIFQWAYALPNQPGLLRGDQIEGDPAG